MIARDWRFSDDGDLILGSPRVDEEGKMLYVDRFGSTTTDASEGGVPIRDIPTYVAEDAQKQVIRNRLQTDAPDWLLHPLMGGSLSDLVGEPNTRETAEKGTELILNAIAYDKYMSPENVKVRPIPVDAQTILFYIQILFSNREFAYPVLFNLEHGILSEYEVKDNA